MKTYENHEALLHDIEARMDEIKVPWPTWFKVHLKAGRCVCCRKSAGWEELYYIKAIDEKLRKS